MRRGGLVRGSSGSHAIRVHDAHSKPLRQQRDDRDRWITAPGFDLRQVRLAQTGLPCHDLLREFRRLAKRLDSRAELAGEAEPGLAGWAPLDPRRPPISDSFSSNEPAGVAPSLKGSA